MRSASWLSCSVARVSACSFSSSTMAAAARAIFVAARSFVLSNSGVPSRVASLAAAPETPRMSLSNAVGLAPDTLASAVA